MDVDRCLDNPWVQQHNLNGCLSNTGVNYTISMDVQSQVDLNACGELCSATISSR